MRTKVGIFFGGPSREREISFAGGRTVYDNLNKALFEPVPIFVDSFERWYLLDWEYLYKGSIRDFFPPVELLPEQETGIQIYQESLGPLAEPTFDEIGKHIGRRVRRDEVIELIDVAFLALHGIYGEDGRIQQELEYVGIPYTGSGIAASQVGMDKTVQKVLMSEKGFPTPAIEVVNRAEFFSSDIRLLFERASMRIGWPMVIRPANQGSSIGVSIIREEDGLEGFTQALNAAFFRTSVSMANWRERSDYDKLDFVRFISDLRDGLAYPVDAKAGDRKITIYTPDDLLQNLQQWSEQEGLEEVILEAHQDEQRVLIEAFIAGKEFSCIVLRQEDGECVALPPTEIIKGSEVFDYRSKYLPGLSRKVTPIDLPEAAIDAIRKDCERLFTELGFATYARIDGFYQEDGTIYLNDPNTTSGMMPSSFFFHQAAEIGLSPSEFLTYILRISLWERAQAGGDYGENAANIGAQIDAGIAELQAQRNEQLQVGVLLGGFNAERHISVESGRNVYEKLNSSTKYRPIPIFLSKGAEGEDYHLHILPLNLLLKDNADDILAKLKENWTDHPAVLNIRKDCQAITDKYTDGHPIFAPESLSWKDLGEAMDAIFIALHGRPGEDGQVQGLLEELNLPYNGSVPSSSERTIDKYHTLDSLRGIGLPTAQQLVITEGEFNENSAFCLDHIEAELSYPLVAKPVDDGCSAAVKLIRQRDELHAYCHLMLRTAQLDERQARRELRLKAKEEFPEHNRILFEEFITKGEAIHFLEITGGMITHYGEGGQLVYEVFEPSETPASSTILSLEEKFLAGEGQNITPARLGVGEFSYEQVASQVKADLQRAAEEMGVTGYCRIDAFVRVYADGRVETIVIEINSLPGMTPATAIFHQAALLGDKPFEFIDQLLTFGSEREARRLIGSTENLIAEVAEDMKNVPAGVTSSSTNAAQAAATLAMETKPATDNTPDDYSGLESPNTGGSEDTPRWKQILLELKDFFISRYFAKNLGVLIGLLLLAFWAIKGGLNCYTQHGQSLELPNFENMLVDDARELAQARGLSLKIEEGAFAGDRQVGLVVMQEPPAGSRIKRERSIYLTVLTDKAPMKQLPSLVGNYDYDVYTRILASKNIKFRIVDQVYDPRQEENTILHFFYDDQKITDEDLRRGVQVPEGAELSFVVTVRRTGQVSMPELVCQTYGESQFEMASSQLLVGEVVGDYTSRDEAYVYRTEPAAGQSVAEGSRVKLYLSDSLPEGCQ